MQSTNIHNLPTPLVRAILNDPYNAGKADISTTRLISPPQLETLRYRHRDEIVEDVSERIWTLLGQATHIVAERASVGTDVISEKRFFAPMEGWIVSGAVDLIEGTKLIDYKVTSVWTHIYKSRIEEWTQQGNVNRWLAHQNGHTTIESMENILILRDWARRDMKKVGYPPVQVVVQPLEVWPLDVAEAYVRERVLLHQKARLAPDDQMPACSDDETWLNAATGKRNRCEDYCAAKAFCSQYKRQAQEAAVVVPITRKKKSDVGL